MVQRSSSYPVSENHGYSFTIANDKCLLEENSANFVKFSALNVFNLELTVTTRSKNGFERVLASDYASPSSIYANFSSQ
jgi:hypothetical protein